MNKQAYNPDDILTVDEVSAWLRVSAAWVRAHANGNRRPVLPSIKMGGHRRFRRKDIERFLDELAKTAA